MPKRNGKRAKVTSKEISRLDDESLLKLRFCDLDLRIEDTVLQDRIDQLYEELEGRGIRFRPHFWLADEWFSPDGVPGVAIPFYLAHPRLLRLERKQMLEAEGSTQQMCMKILRHETGHAIDTAFRLRRKKRYREVFGKVSQPYPRYYQPQPYSKEYVLHLDMWYAQSHPVEDFAETFAVWLRPRSPWRTQYQGWPALKKLTYVDSVVNEVKEKRHPVCTREFVEPISKSRKTLASHYANKRQYYGVEYPSFYDRDLRRLFSSSECHRRNVTAAAFLKRNRCELRKSVARWTGEYQYTIDQVLSEMIDRCRDLRLRVGDSQDTAMQDVLVLLTMQTMNYLHEGHHRLAL